MGLFNAWFGKESFFRDLSLEIKDLDLLLKQTSEEDHFLENPVERIKFISRLLNKRLNEESYVFSISKKIKKLIDASVSGKHKTRNKFKFILLSQILNEFHNDSAWLDLANLFAKEKELYSNPLKNKSKILKIHESEKKIISYLKIISQSELVETHSHFNMSADVDSHWKYLKRYWKEALRLGLTSSSSLGIIFAFENAKNEGVIFSKDLSKLKLIMTNFFSGSYNDYKAMLEFEKLLFMQDDHHGSFGGFNKKANIINVIYEYVSKEHRSDYLVNQLCSIARHNMNNNITQIEIRFPLKTRQDYLEMAFAAKKAELKFKGFKIRFVPGLGFNDSQLNESISSYLNLPNYAKKYVVAFESNSLSVHSPLPVVIHAGEFYSTKDHAHGFSRTDKLGNIKKSLDQISSCLKTINIYRIGHANILGLDIVKYLKGHDRTKILSLVKLQSSLLRKIHSKGIIIEANPTSNIKIAGLKTYRNHPISKFNKHRIKFSISTDDRIIFDTTLKKEYYHIAKALNWEDHELRRAIEMSREAKL